MSTDLKPFPLVSILIPTYNSEKFIARSIESAINQSYPNLEIVIVDNASADETVSIVNSYVNRYPNVRAYRNACNIGPVKNWQRCVMAMLLSGGVLVAGGTMAAPFGTIGIALAAACALGLQKFLMWWWIKSNLGIDTHARVDRNILTAFGFIRSV